MSEEDKCLKLFSLGNIQTNYHLFYYVNQNFNLANGSNYFTIVNSEFALYFYLHFMGNFCI